MYVQKQLPISFTLLYHLLVILICTDVVYIMIQNYS
jgi:hypothetical protein